MNDGEVTSCKVDGKEVRGRKRKETEVSEMILLQTELQLKLCKLDVLVLPEQSCSLALG